MNISKKSKSFTIAGYSVSLESLKRTSRRKREGFILPLVAITTVLLFFAGLGLVQLGSNSQMMAIRTKQATAARIAADAGVNRAIYEMNKNLGVDIWKFEDVASSVSASLLESNASYAFTITEITGGTNYKITSTGNSGLSQKTISVTLKKQGLFDNAIFAAGYAQPKHPKSEKGDSSGNKPKKKGGKLTLKEYDIESYSSEQKKSQGNGNGNDNVEIRSNGNHKGTIKLEGKIVIDSDIAVGPGAKPENVIEKKDGAKMNGSVYASPEIVEILPVALPESLDKIITQKYKYEDDKPISGTVAFSEFELKKDKVQSISGNCAIYVENDMKIEDGAQLIIPKGSSLSLYIGGKLEVKKKDAGIINETKDATKLTIYGTDTCEKIKIENQTEDFYGGIYAPWAKVELKKTADIYGAVVGWDVKLETDKKNPGTLYFDEALRGGDTVRFVPTSWKEE